MYLWGNASSMDWGVSGFWNARGHNRNNEHSAWLAYHLCLSLLVPGNTRQFQAVLGGLRQVPGRWVQPWEVIGSARYKCRCVISVISVHLWCTEYGVWGMYSGIVLYVCILIDWPGLLQLLKNLTSLTSQSWFHIPFIQNLLTCLTWWYSGRCWLRNLGRCCCWCCCRRRCRRRCVRNRGSED